MSLETAAFLLGVLLMLVSIPRIMIHLYEWFKDLQLLRNGQRVKGVIKEAVTYPNDDSLNSGQYRFIAEFVDGASITRYAKSRFADRSLMKYMHKEVVIVYDPKDPSISRFLVDISIMRDVIEYICLFVVGAALVALWIWILG